MPVSLPGPGGTEASMGECCCEPCSQKWEWFIIIGLAQSTIDWINGSVGEPAGCQYAPMPEPTNFEWNALATQLAGELEALDFDHPPIAWGNNVHYDSFGDKLEPCWFNQTRYPIADSDDVMRGNVEWCNGVSTPSCSGFLDVLEVLNLSGNSLIAGPEGGITIATQKYCGFQYGIGVPCEPGIPFMLASRVRLSGYGSHICTSVRSYETGFVIPPVVESCENSATTAGKLILPFPGEVLITGIPEYPWTECHVKVRARAAWTEVPCQDCVCP